MILPIILEIINWIIFIFGIILWVENKPQDAIVCIGVAIFILLARGDR